MRLLSLHHWRSNKFQVLVFRRGELSSFELSIKILDILIENIGSEFLISTGLFHDESFEFLEELMDFIIFMKVLKYFPENLGVYNIFIPLWFFIRVLIECLHFVLKFWSFDLFLTCLFFHFVKEPLYCFTIELGLNIESNFCQKQIEGLIGNIPKIIKVLLPGLLQRNSNKINLLTYMIKHKLECLMIYFFLVLIFWLV